MTYKFIQSDAEGYAFGIVLFLYLFVLAVVLSKTASLQRNKKVTEVKRKQKIGRLIKIGIVALVGCAAIHWGLYKYLLDYFPSEGYAQLPPRDNYYLSILLTLICAFVIFILGLYFKGNSTLPNQNGRVSGV